MSDNSFTVTYGREGTKGQSRTKTFLDAEKCHREGEKVIAEKIRKGYLEDAGELMLTSKSLRAKKSATDLLVKEYNDIIKDGKVGALLPFLKNMSHQEKSEIKKQVRKAKLYWMTYMDLSQDSIFKKLINNSGWGIRATREQQEVIVLSAIALFNRKEIASWIEVLSYFDHLEEKYVLEILEWARPIWISEFILEKITKNDWLSVDYKSVRQLEDLGLIEYSPELFVRSIVRFSPWKDSGNWKHQDYIEYITTDATAYNRDVPQIFNYETALQNQYFGNFPSESHKAILVWERILNRLLIESKVDRAWFIENCISVQTKEWNGGLRSFFRKRLADAGPTAKEILTFQNLFFHCLHSPLNTVVNFAVEHLKVVSLEDTFHFSEFLQWVEPVMMRGDCKGAVKTLLGVFEKVLKTKPEFKATISYLVTDIFVIPDLSLQQRAYKTLIKVFDVDDITLQDKFEMYLPQMQGDIAVLISGFLNKKSAEKSGSEQVYELVSGKSKVLTDENKILPFSNWNEILFQFGKFLSSIQVIEGEKLVNAFITQSEVFPPDAMDQLKVYSKQLQKMHFNGMDKNAIAALLIHIIERREGALDPAPILYRSSKIITLPKQIVKECHKKIIAGSTLPLLSFPTHAPHWVDPVVLIERLLEYQKIGWKKNDLDFTIALSRMPRENTELALQLCEQLNDDEADIIKFALGASDKIELRHETFLKKIFSNAKSAQVVNHATWAVVARTFYPNQNFIEFDSTSLKELPNVARPFLPSVKVNVRRNEYKNYFTKQEGHFEFRELSLDIPDSKWGIPDNLLYSLDVFERKSTKYSFNFLSHGDVLYWHSLMPQNDQALATMILRYGCKNDQSGSEDLNAFLYLSAQDGFIFTDTSIFVVACCMFCKELKTRSYASEILIYLINNKKIDVRDLGEKTGYLISENYGPVQRFTDVVTALKDISPLHNAALIILLDSLFLHFTGKDRLPVNFKKLLELYLDLLLKSGKKPQENTLSRILSWKDYNAIKPVLKQIRSI